MSETRSVISRATWARRNSWSATSCAKRARRARSNLAIEEEVFVVHRPSRSRLCAGPLQVLSWAPCRPARQSLALSRRPAAPAMAGRASGAMGRMLRRLADVLLPPVCISCRAPHRKPRTLMRGLLRQNRFHRASALRPARAAASLRGGRDAAFGGGHRLAASLRPRAGRGAIFGHDARAHPELQIPGPA